LSLPDPFDELNLGAQSVRRRDLREKSTRRSRKAARKRAVAVRKAPPTRTAAAKKPQNRRVAGKLFSAVALLLAAGFLLVNTVGFLAMPATTATASSTTADDTGQATIAGQSLTAANDGENAPIDRDTFAATSAEEYGQMQDLASVAGYTVNNSGTIRWPFNSPVPLGDPFGPRVAPCAGCSTFHNGTDFETGDLASVYATAAGTVTQAGIIGDLGEAVEIDHDVNGQKFTSVYGHMTMGSLKVSVGDKITEGELVGLTGSTGESTGPHLFFGIDINGTPIDSFKWLKEYTAH
jgi:murein DD-endopeptidase MepM/ murein hydrolase activator NlpD